MGYQLLPAHCKANVRYCHGSSGCIVVYLHLPSSSQSALFSPFIDQQELDEFSYSDAPRQAADECQVALVPFHTISPMHH